MVGTALLTGIVQPPALQGLARLWRRPSPPALAGRALLLRVGLHHESGKVLVGVAQSSGSDLPAAVMMPKEPRAAVESPPLLPLATGDVSVDEPDSCRTRGTLGARFGGCCVAAIATGALPTDDALPTSPPEALELRRDVLARVLAVSSASRASSSPPFGRKYCHRVTRFVGDLPRFFCWNPISANWSDRSIDSAERRCRAKSEAWIAGCIPGCGCAATSRPATVRSRTSFPSSAGIWRRA